MHARGHDKAADSRKAFKQARSGAKREFQKAMKRIQNVLDLIRWIPKEALFEFAPFCGYLRLFAGICASFAPTFSAPKTCENATGL